MFLQFLFTFLVILAPTATVRSADLRPEINIIKHLFFPDFTGRFPHDITFLGSAGISPENGCLQIPEKELKFSAGRAIYSSPIRLLDPTTGSPASFSTTFSFRISGKPASGGLSFIIAADELTVGRPGPWLAMMNDACAEENFKMFAVEFDTLMNPEFGDPNDNHVGINLGSVVSTAAINASDFGIRLDDGEIHRAWVKYDGDRKFIEIYLGRDDETVPPSKPGYSGELNLSPYLNEYMFVGFSGSTGENYTRSHSVCSWNFTAISRGLLRFPSSESCESKITVENPKHSRRPQKEAPIIFYIVVALLLLAIGIIIAVYFSCKRKKKENSHEKNRCPPIRPRSYSSAAVSAATGGFSELQITESDSNSVSYKGYLPGKISVIVKRVSSGFCDSNARKKMMDEIKRVGKIRHPNLVAIRGWCFDNEETVVIYDYVPNGTLDKWMVQDGGLSWNRRFRIIKDVADALRYLHSRDLAHKNVKSSSVFLDVSFRSVLGNFGFGSVETTHSTKFESLIRQNIDVFEFGIVILEVVSGSDRAGELLDRAWRMHERNEKEKFVDRRIGSMVIVDQAVRVMEIGLLCTLNESKGRPTMGEVVEYLNDDRVLPDLPDVRPVCLFPYNSNTGLVCGRHACAPFQLKT